MFLTCLGGLLLKWSSSGSVLEYVYQLYAARMYFSLGEMKDLII